MTKWKLSGISASSLGLLITTAAAISFGQGEEVVLPNSETVAQQQAHESAAAETSPESVPGVSPTGEAVVQLIGAVAEKAAPNAATEEDARERESLQLARLDLEAQQGMAKYTFWIALLSVAGLALSSIGVYLIARTLKATRDAADAAQASVAATEEMIRQDRAWVAISAMRRTPHYDKTGVLVAHSTDFEIRNVGRTPALNLMVGVAQFEDMPDEPSAASVKARTATEGVARVVGQGLSHFHRMELSAEQLKQIRERKVAHYVYVCAIYWTIYQETYITEWCSKTVISDLPGFDADADATLNFEPVQGLNRNYKFTAPQAGPSKLPLDPARRPAHYLNSV